MSKQAPVEVKEAFFEIVENQIREGAPLETSQTLVRLLGQGITREEAVRLIACAVAVEVYEVLKSKVAYNENRFITNLGKLPTLPWD